jgi:hypothetical protein
MQFKAAAEATMHQTQLETQARVMQWKAAAEATKLQMLAEIELRCPLPKQQKALRGALQRWGYVELEEDGECV